MYKRQAFKMAGVIKRAAELTADKQCIGAGKLVVFCNAVEDNPFMAGAFHGSGEADEVVNVGVSGPGVVRAVLADLPKEADITTVAEAIKATAFKITRAGELMAREASRRLGVQQGILDLSLAPTPAEGDSVAEILEAIGVGQCGGPGTTAALAMLGVISKSVSQRIIKIAVVFTTKIIDKEDVYKRQGA